MEKVCSEAQSGPSFTMSFLDCVLTNFNFTSLISRHYSYPRWAASSTIRVMGTAEWGIVTDGDNLFALYGSLAVSPQPPSPVPFAPVHGVVKILIGEHNLFWIWIHKLAYWRRLWWRSWST